MSEKAFLVSKKHEHIQKTLRIPVPLAEKLEKEADKNNISFNSLVIQCIQYAFDNIEKEENEE